MSCTGEYDRACCSALNSFCFYWHAHLEKVRGKGICQTNDNELEAWETLFKNSGKWEKNVLFNWVKVYPLFVLVPFAFTRPFDSSGTARIIPTSLSLLSGLSGSLINLQAVLFTSVTLSARLRERKRSVAHRGCDLQDY